MAVYNVRIDEEVYKACKVLADKEGRSITNYINRVLLVSTMDADTKTEPEAKLSLKAVPVGEESGNTVVQPSTLEDILPPTFKVSRPPSADFKLGPTCPKGHPSRDGKHCLSAKCPYSL